MMDNEEKEIILDYTNKTNSDEKPISKSGLLGIANGLFGSVIYQSIISFIVSLILTFIVMEANPGLSGEPLQEAFDELSSKFPLVAIVYLAGNIVTLGVFVYLFKWDKVKSLVNKIGDSKVLKYGVIGAFCIMGFSIVYNGLAISLFKIDGSGNANQVDVVNMVTSNYFLGFLAVVILAPIVEEITFRYCLFGEIKKKNRAIAYVVSGVMFMLMHAVSSFSVAGGFNKDFLMEMIYLPPYLFSGLVFCYVYEKTDNLNTNICSHMINNLFSFLALLLV